MVKNSKAYYMNSKHFIQSLLIIITSAMFIGCNKDYIQATDSIEGAWDLVAISSHYGEFSNNGVSPIGTVSESGQLGTFYFTKDSVDFNFMRNDTLYAAKAAWSLDLEKVRSGFTRENDFTLTIEDHFLLEVSFEDETRNAEKNASNMTFIETPVSGFGALIEMTLEKK
jgi:hypothetical protein